MRLAPAGGRRDVRALVLRGIDDGRGHAGPSAKSEASRTRRDGPRWRVVAEAQQAPPKGDVAKRERGGTRQWHCKMRSPSTHALAGGGGRDDR